MPKSTTAIPTHCRALGTTPCVTSTASGTIGLAAEIGATMPIAPTARPRYSAARPIAPAAPAPTAGSRSSTDGSAAPLVITQIAAPTSPTA